MPRCSFSALEFRILGIAVRRNPLAWVTNTLHIFLLWRGPDEASSVLSLIKMMTPVCLIVYDDDSYAYCFQQRLFLLVCCSSLREGDFCYYNIRQFCQSIYEPYSGRYYYKNGGYPREMYIKATLEFGGS